MFLHNVILCDVCKKVVNNLAICFFPDYLRGCYIENRFVAENEWPPYQPKHYTALAVIHYKNSNAQSITELALQGSKLLKVTSKSKIDYGSEISDTYSNTTKNISDLFKPEWNSDGAELTPNLILIEGAPGMGKTILSKEIALQWAKNTLLTFKKLLFLILLRNFDTSIKSVDEFVQHVTKTKNEKDVKLITENNGQNLAVVLDGYDELSENDRNKSFIADLVFRRVLPKCLLVITSRPTASLHLHDFVNCRRVEVVGFSEIDRIDYIKNELPHDSCEKIIDYLRCNPTINALCYIPLNMTILLSLTKKDIGNLPETQTELYESFIKETVARHLKRHSNAGNSIVVTKLPPPQNEGLFNELAYFAFNALDNNRLVFTLDELKSICPKLTMTADNWNGLGLIHSVKSFDNKEKIAYHFLHFSIQEYMAAYYITSLSDEKQKNFFKTHFGLFVTIILGSCMQVSLVERAVHSKVFSKKCLKFLLDKMKSQNLVNI